jgi:hypothetical protein
MLPVSGEQHEKAREATRHTMSDLAMNEMWSPLRAAEAGIAAYFASLAAHGVRLVDVSEVAEWLRTRGEMSAADRDRRVLAKAADDLLARFGGGDKR